MILSCAEVAPPPGGEADEAGPSLLTVIPANGSTNVPPTDRVVLQFSERVVEPRAGKAFFISPRFAEEPRVRWHGDRIEIIFPDSIQPDQTYIISLSSTITDLRGNRFDSAGTIAFSTGATLDSGRVSGTVMNNRSPMTGLLAALYEMDLFAADSVIWDSLPPTYLTTTNQQGRFSFAYLPDREYRLVVFQDRNGNERFNPGREAFALPDRPIAVNGPLPLTDLRLSMTSEDTTSAGILSATFTADRLLRIRTVRAIPTAFLAANPSNMVLRPLADTTQAVRARSILETERDSSATLTAWFGRPDTGQYRLEVTFDPERPALIQDTIAIGYPEDRSRPTIVAFTPDQGSHFLRDLDPTITFSEPLDTAAITPETFVFWREPDSIQVPVGWSWRDPFRIGFEKESLKEGESYRVSVTEFELRDPAGNTVGDSLREYRFSTLNVDSLGSIAGTISVELTDLRTAPIMLTFRRVGKTESYTLRAVGTSFVIDVPAGDYLLSGFIDTDLDGVLSLGSLHPYRFAETQASLVDTVEVRARFETAGSELIFR